MLCQGLGTAVVAYLVTMTILEAKGLYPVGLSEVVTVMFLVLQGALIGGFLGLWVPKEYRRLSGPKPAI